MPAAAPNPALFVRGPTRLEPLSFRRTPVLWAALALAAGITLAHTTYQPIASLALALAILTSLTLLSLTTVIQTEKLRPLSIAALWLTAGFLSAQIQPAPNPQTALHPYADNLSRTVQAAVTRIRTLPPASPPDQDPDADPEEIEAQPTISIDLAVTAIEDVTPDTSHMVPITGGIRATLLSTPSTPTLHCGDQIQAPLRLHLAARYRDPGAWQYADYLLTQGISAQSTLHKFTITPGPATFACRLYAAQTWAATRMDTYTASQINRHLPRLLRLTPEDTGMLNAMLFGDRTALNHTLRLAFERTGSFHLFVVSGMHVGLIALGLFWLSRRAHAPPWLATAVTILLTTACAALTGFGVPVQRALWMIGLFLIARLLHRTHNTLNALGAAVLGVLVYSPSTLFEASFQMTFLAIAAIAGIAHPLAERTLLPTLRATHHLRETWRDTRIPPKLAQLRITLRLIAEPLARILGRPAYNLPALTLRIALRTLELTLIALVAETIMALPMALYFHRATLFALPANLVSIPLLVFLLPAAILTFVASLLSPWLAATPAAITALLLHFIRTLITRIARTPTADLRIPGPSIPACTLALACIAFAVWATRQPKRIYPILATLTLPLILLIILYPHPPLTTPNTLEITAIDVGQGDSLLVVSPTGAAMLIDAGGPVGSSGHAAPTTAFDIGEEVVAPYLWSRRLRSLDIVALTHEHSDHMGGMPAILRIFHPRELWLGVDVPSTAYTALLAEAATLHIPVRHLRAGDQIPWQSLTIDVLAPESTYRNPLSPKNDDSLVLHMQYGRASVLLEGDAEHPEESAMLLNHRITPVTLLKVGHHGSATSSTQDFLAAASPKDAVISVGRGNTFGHPRPEVIARFAQQSVKLYRTDMHGVTTFLLRPDGSIEAAAGTSQ
jgi:competence protein ComEC